MYIFNNYIVISGFIANEMNENRIFNVIVMSVMILKQKHIKINDTQISVIVKLLD